MKVFRIISEFRVFRLIFHRKSASLLYFVQKMQKYPSDISVSENCIDRNL